MWDHFEKWEFACKCGCGTNIISNTLVNKLDVARAISGVGFKINSGCRCENHNRSVGGSSTSSHKKGFAVDIKAEDSATRFRILKALIAVGFNRIGIYKTFIHVDIDPDKPSYLTWYK